MRFTLDSNILVYALDVTDESRHRLAADIVDFAVRGDAFLTTQVLGECLNVARRRRVGAFPDVLAQVERWHTLFEIVDTASPMLMLAARVAEEHRLQFWDSVLCTVARSAGAEFLLSEDLQDGRDLNGLHIANPFSAANFELLGELRASVEE